MYASTPSTVHSWSIRTENRTFRSLHGAIEYASEHADELHEIEVFVHAGGSQYEIISGDELTSLVTSVCVRH
ncbi:hypothetical protein B5K05_23875 [Rhizobium phaseoli]|nr:hypothetical protein B5K04_23810 [Rhizobium phaseoli]RDJ06999.1 hypothetical protein B5K05_23875 [Rhizobium phaseoli]